jgi:hypothetical protein
MIVVDSQVDWGATDFTVDLSGVTLSGAAGLVALVSLNDHVEANGGRMLVAGAAGVTRQAMEATGVETVVSTFLGGGHNRLSERAQGGDVDLSSEPDPARRRCHPTLAGHRRRGGRHRRVRAAASRAVPVAVESADAHRRSPAHRAVRSIQPATAASVTVIIRDAPLAS